MLCVIGQCKGLIFLSICVILCHKNFIECALIPAGRFTGPGSHPGPLSYMVSIGHRVLQSDALHLLSA
jgi:hypothetical protein